MTEAPPPPSHRQRLRKAFLEFGSLGLGVHYTIYALVLLGFVLTLRSSNLSQSGAVQSGTALGVWVAAYVATKLTLPLRALGTLALTPLLRGLVRRVRKPTRRLPVVVEAPCRPERAH